MSSDQLLTRTDSAVSTKTDTKFDGANKILSEQTNGDVAGINNRSQITAHSEALVASLTIPHLHLSGLEPNTEDAPPQQESGFAKFFHDVGTVAADVGNGMVNEVTQHPLEVLEAGAVGLGIGIAATAAAVLLAPEVMVTGVVLAAGYGVSQLLSHTPGFVHDALVVSNESDYSAEEVAQAHENLHDVGRGTTLMLAGTAGGLATGLVSSAVESTVSDLVLPRLGITGFVDDVAPGAIAADAPAALVAESGAPVASTEAALASTETAVASTEGAVASTEGAVASTEGAVASAETTVADATATVKAAEVAEPVASAAPLTVEQSVEINQNLFRASQDEIVPSVKQLYQVKFEKAGPGGQLVKTLENPAGVEVPEGQWIATRLNPDGTPNIERGMVNTWTPSEKAILKGYKLTPEELADNTNITGWTNTEAPPVHMVQLKEPIDIQTAWGPMHGDAGSWLANYDYNPATGAPGSSWAIVTEQSYAATYKPV